MYTVISAVAVYISGLCTSVLVFVVESCCRFNKKREEQERIKKQDRMKEQYRTHTDNMYGTQISQLSVYSVSEVTLK